MYLARNVSVASTHSQNGRRTAVAKMNIIIIITIVGQRRKRGLAHIWNKLNLCVWKIQNAIKFAVLVFSKAMHRMQSESTAIHSSGFGLYGMRMESLVETIHLIEVTNHATRRGTARHGYAQGHDNLVNVSCPLPHGSSSPKESEGETLSQQIAVDQWTSLS